MHVTKAPAKVPAHLVRGRVTVRGRVGVKVRGRGRARDGFRKVPAAPLHRRLRRGVRERHVPLHVAPG